MVRLLSALALVALVGADVGAPPGAARAQQWCPGGNCPGAAPGPSYWPGPAVYGGGPPFARAGLDLRLDVRFGRPAPRYFEYGPPVVFEERFRVAPVLPGPFGGAPFGAPPWQAPYSVYGGGCTGSAGYAGPSAYVGFGASVGGPGNPYGAPPYYAGPAGP